MAEHEKKGVTDDSKLVAEMLERLQRLEDSNADLKRERDAAEARAHAAETRAGVRPTVGSDPVTLKDVKDANVLKLVGAAQKAAPAWDDSVSNRKAFAGKAQDLVIALRGLDVEVSTRGLFCPRNASSPGNGDVYVLATGVHPRDVARVLVEQFTAGHLADLVDDLEKALQREAS